MDFEIIGEIRHPETFARGAGIRDFPRPRKIHGLGKGVSIKVLPVHLHDDSLREAEIQWYAATCIGSVNLILSFLCRLA
jgi:hypothetical protein